MIPNCFRCAAVRASLIPCGANALNAELPLRRGPCGMTGVSTRVCLPGVRVEVMSRQKKRRPLPPKGFVLDRPGVRRARTLGFGRYWMSLPSMSTVNSEAILIASRRRGRRRADEFKLDWLDLLCLCDVRHRDIIHPTAGESVKPERSAGVLPARPAAGQRVVDEVKARPLTIFEAIDRLRPAPRRPADLGDSPLEPFVHGFEEQLISRVVRMHAVNRVQDVDVTPCRSVGTLSWM